MALFFRENLGIFYNFLLIFNKNMQLFINFCEFLPENTRKKKCHLIWKIATFFGNFDPHFSEKYTFSVKSPKNDHVPN